MKIILHLGAYKTGSSHLQYNLERNKKILEANGIIYFKFHDRPKLKKEVVRLRKEIRSKAFDAEASAARINHQIQQAITGYKAAILSYEGILGSLNNYKKRDIYEHAEDLLPLYADLFKEHEVIPVFVTRNYDPFFRSSYKYLLRHFLFPYTLEEFLNNVQFSPKRWTTIIKEISTAFGEPVRFFSQEAYREKGDIIFKHLIGLTGQPLPPNRLHFDFSGKNVSKADEFEMDFYYSLNCQFKKLPKFKFKRKLALGLKKHLSFLFNNKLGRHFLHPYKHQDIPPLNEQTAYLEEIRKLKETYGILEED